MTNTSSTPWVRRTLARPEVGVLIATLLLGVAFAASSSSFLTEFNIFNMSRQAGLYVWIALAQAMVLVVGGMNLSIGQIGGMTVVAAGYLMEYLGAPIWVAMLGGLLVGVLAGALNGIIITVLKLNSFVVTLATSFIFQGLIAGISQGNPYTKIPPEITFVGTKGVGALPWLLVSAILVLAALSFLYRLTVTGRGLLATGGNLTAARLSGIPTNRMIVVAHILSGALASGAGLLWVSRTGTAQPTTGADWMLISFAVAVIGGTAMAGGAINMPGILFAAFLITMVKNGLVMANVNIYFEQTYLGLILLIAVALPGLRSLLGRRSKPAAVAKKSVVRAVTPTNTAN